MKPVRQMTQAELAAFVQSHLRKKGIQVVLSGGATVAIYSHGKYVSNYLDLVDVYSIKRKIIRDSMEIIGFLEEGRYFKHRDSKFLIEFPPGPLTVGLEPIKEIDEIKLSTGILRIISPTDCVKDRLAAYYHWGDNQCLAQAVMVAQANDIKLEEIQRWSVAEGKRAEFENIIDKLKRKSDTKSRHSPPARW
jgi:hypothetical protein